MSVLFLSQRGLDGGKYSGNSSIFFEDFIRELNLDFIMVIKNGDLGDKLFLFIISKALMIKGG